MTKYVFGVDMGGTTVKQGLFDAVGTLLKKWEIPTRKEDSGEWILPDVADSIKALMSEVGISKTNDANVAAYGEMLLGGGKGHKNVVMVTLGTGVGGGIIGSGKY